MEVSIHQAKKQLSRLLERVLLGQEVVIARAGTPIAKLVPIGNNEHTRKLGTAKGEFTVPKTFNNPLPRDVEEKFWK